MYRPLHMQEALNRCYASVGKPNPNLTLIPDFIGLHKIKKIVNIKVEGRRSWVEGFFSISQYLVSYLFEKKFHFVNYRRTASSASFRQFPLVCFVSSITESPGICDIYTIKKSYFAKMYISRVTKVTTDKTNEMTDLRMAESESCCWEGSGDICVDLVIVPWKCKSANK